MFVTGLRILVPYVERKQQNKYVKNRFMLLSKPIPKVNLPLIGFKYIDWNGIASLVKDCFTYKYKMNLATNGVVVTNPITLLRQRKLELSN